MKQRPVVVVVIDYYMVICQSDSLPGWFFKMFFFMLNVFDV